MHTAYRDVDHHFKEKEIQPTLKTVREAILSIRAQKFPSLSKVGTAGSFFKNPIIEKQDVQKFQEIYPNMPHYEMNDGCIKVPLAWILEHVCALKGFRKGHFGTFERQPLVVVHYGGGTARELKTFASFIQKSVKEKTNINIVPEVTFV